MKSHFQALTPTDDRPEIGDAVRAIIDRIKEGHSTTAIVMPPRTGKSDIIRAAALEASALFNAGSVVLAPWIFLRDQLVDPEKVGEFQKRLRVRNYETGTLESGLFNGRFYEQRPRRDLWSMTISAASQEASLLNLEEAARNLKELGALLMLLVDEGHRVSSDQSDGWGEVVARLEAAGAHIVLLTGTPYRSDNIAPFGFTVTELQRTPTMFKVPGFDESAKPIFRRYVAERVLYHLEADYELARSEAWTKGYLLHVQARWFSFYADGNIVNNDTDRGIARRALAKAVRDPEVIRQAAELVVDDVMGRRHVAPESAAIVFVGNDAANEAADERHTNQVKTIIEHVWRQKTGMPCVVTVAMQRGMNQKEAANRISRFIGNKKMPGHGDVLIVKQMGSVGLDGGRIKTAGDLSVIRAVTNTTQRWLRVATPWADKDGKPLATYGTLILPGDPITTDLYQYIVAEQGGDLASLESKVRLDDEDREPGEKPDEIKISNPHNAGVTDFLLRRIGAGKGELVARILRQQPKLSLIYDRVEIARRLDSGQLKIIDEEDTEEDEVEVYDLQSDIESLWSEINDLTKKYADQRCDYGTQREAWVHTRRVIASEAKRHAEINVELRACHDKPRLQVARDYLKARCG